MCRPVTYCAGLLPFLQICLLASLQTSYHQYSPLYPFFRPVILWTGLLPTSMSLRVLVCLLRFVHTSLTSLQTRLPLFKFSLWFGQFFTVCAVLLSSVQAYYPQVCILGFLYSVTLCANLFTPVQTRLRPVQIFFPVSANFFLPSV
jgi:hypothetical protein